MIAALPKFKTLLNSAFIVSLFLWLLAGCTSKSTDIYVIANDDRSGKQGFTSIMEAMEEVGRLRNDNQKGLINIHLGEGEFRLTETIRLGPESGPIGIIGEGPEKTIIKGSMLLNLIWTKYKDSIYVAKVAKNERFDQLFINGQQQILARYPNYDENGGHWQGSAEDAISPARIKTWKHPNGAIVNVMHSGEWGDFHYVVTGVDDHGEAILEGGQQNNRPSKMHEKYRMVENVFEELDSPGEWYLSEDNKLYFWPQVGVDLNNAKAEGVMQKHLMEIVGALENPVKNLSVQGIRFEHAQRTYMENYEPLLRSDWTIYRGGAVFLENTQNVSITDCEFTNLGGNAVFVSKYNRGTLIQGNHIHEIGATGICFVGDPNAVRSPSFQYNEFVPLTGMDTIRGPKTEAYPSDGTADNNLIYRIGRVEKQTAGVEIAIAMNITVSNNSIYEVPRAGINIGDGTWGGHIIEGNDVFSTVLESGDHGAFNSWGRDRFWHPNRSKMDQMVADNPEMPLWDAIHMTIIRHNRFRCDHGWDIDLDDGSSNYGIYNNVCLNGGIKLREGFHRTVENNIMLNNGFHPHVWFRESGDIFRHNIVSTEHRDIRLEGWGKEVDYNLFPDKESLENAQKNGVDENSVFGDPLFIDAGEGNYQIKEGSPAYKIGFNPFETDDFGVKTPKLKALAKTPEIPALFFGEASDKSASFNWLGGKIRNITTMAQRSASGLNKTAGVMVVKVEENSVLGESGLQEGDVIIASEGEELNSVPDLMKLYQAINWKGQMNLTIHRNQNEMKVTLITK